jgi:amidohydrolase
VTDNASDAPVVDTSVASDAKGLLADAVEVRRRVHAEPELGLDLPRTQKVVLDALAGLGLKVHTGKATTSVVAVLDGARPGPTTLLRADMDALPMSEETGLPFASRVEGRMHACGHDAHVAMLLGAARLLSGRRAELAGRVVFMFQPGEESYGGAKVMLDEGLLERHGPVDRGFAIHITPELPSGWVATRGGPVMASADEFRITVTGAGGHASMPHNATDPVPVACEIVIALLTMVTRRVPAFDPAVLTIARVAAGTATNVIPDRAVLEGTIRALSDSTRDRVVEEAAHVAEHLASAHRCRAELELLAGNYPVTVNDAASAESALATAATLFGADRTVTLPTPVMGAEDWSYVLQRVTGSMTFLGAAPPGVEHPEPNHSNRFLIDEEAMAAGIALHAAMALR